MCPASWKIVIFHEDNLSRRRAYFFILSVLNLIIITFKTERIKKTRKAKIVMFDNEINTQRTTKHYYCWCFWYHHHHHRQRTEICKHVATAYLVPGKHRSLYRAADKSLARPGRKQDAPFKSVMGRRMDWFG